MVLRPETRGAVDEALRQIPGLNGLVPEAASLKRLTGGATNAMYRVEASRAEGGQRRLCLRVSPLHRSGRETARASALVEATVLKAVRAQGCLVPEVLGVLPDGGPLGAGFFMGWVDGETLGQRLAASSEFETLRCEGRLGRQLGEALAHIHRANTTPLRGVVPESPGKGRLEVASLRKWYVSLGVCRPALEYVFCWLDANAPADSDEPQVLVHGDFRTGNFVARPHEGLVSVLDWESAHLGNRYEDLGWLCVRSWCYGQVDRPVGGVALLEDFCCAYESAGGLPVDRDVVLWWAMLGSVRWACLCIDMGRGFQRDHTRLEHAVVGRRTSEAELDCLLMIGDSLPGGVAEILSGSNLASRQAGSKVDIGQFPSESELLHGVSRHLKDESVAALTAAGDSRGAFMLRVAANALDIVARGQREASDLHRYELRFLRQLLQADGGLSLPQLRERFVEQLRAGLSLETPGLLEHLLRKCAWQVSVDQPKYQSLAGIKSML